MERIVQQMAPDTQLGPSPGWVLPVALLVGLAFGFIGFRARGKWIFPAVSGAMLTLVIGLALSSLADADALPYTRAIRHHRQLVAFLVTVIVAGIAVAIAAFRARGAFKDLKGTYVSETAPSIGSR